jgi:hypothetical protein
LRLNGVNNVSLSAKIGSPIAAALWSKSRLMLKRHKKGLQMPWFVHFTLHNTPDFDEETLRALELSRVQHLRFKTIRADCRSDIWIDANLQVNELEYLGFGTWSG